MKNLILASLFTLALPAASLGAENRPKPKVRSEESLFLDMHKIGLGSLSELEEKKKFIETIRLEKEKIQAKMLSNVYENAFDYYRQGNYEEARGLALKILSIDPSNEDAGMLLEASDQLKGALRPSMSEKVMLEDRFKSALSLYNDGRVLDAHKKMEEVVKLSPNNIKAKYWLAKMKEDLKDYYFHKGEESYAKRDLKGALDNFYNALLIRPKDTGILEYITKVEDELRQETANEKLKAALESYAQGRLNDAYLGLRGVLEIQPGDSKANKLLSEVKAEIEQKYIERGKRSYGERRYTEAIAEWNGAKPYTANLAYLDKLISRAKEQMRVESDERKRRSEESARKAKEEEERRQKEEAEAAELAKKAKQTGTGLGEGPIGGKTNVVSEENRLAAQSHYIEGLKYFQNSNYEKARDEWTIVRQLDPGNTDADAGLKRIEQILAGGQ